jgi:hypothetical protein
MARTVTERKSRKVFVKRGTKLKAAPKPRAPPKAKPKAKRAPPAHKPAGVHVHVQNNSTSGSAGGAGGGVTSTNPHHSSYGAGGPALFNQERENQLLAKISALGASVDNFKRGKDKDKAEPGEPAPVKEAAPRRGKAAAEMMETDEPPPPFPKVAAAPAPQEKKAAKPAAEPDTAAPMMAAPAAEAPFPEVPVPDIAPEPEPGLQLVVRETPALVDVPPIMAPDPEPADIAEQALVVHGERASSERRTHPKAVRADDKEERAAEKLSRAEQGRAAVIQQARNGLVRAANLAMAKESTNKTLARIRQLQERALVLGDIEARSNDLSHFHNPTRKETLLHKNPGLRVNVQPGGTKKAHVMGEKEEAFAVDPPLVPIGAYDVLFEPDPLDDL